MPSCPRSDVLDPMQIGICHCWNRCVRRAFLCGKDPRTGKNYDHRRDWIQDRLTLLARLFAIEVGFHAELTNHIHLVLRNRPDVVETWANEDVVRRILTIHALTRHFEHRLPEVRESEVKITARDAKKVAEFRRRLSDISWFMKSIDEYLARRSNHEDGVTGAFWEGRFACRRIEDEAGLIVCGVYVDLNQIRAGEALVPEESVHTSAYDRIRGRTLREKSSASDQMFPDDWLCELTLQEGDEADDCDGTKAERPFRLTDKGLLPLSFEAYLELLDWTGRQLVEGKAGAIPDHLAPILERLHIRPACWIRAVEGFEKMFGMAIGRAEAVAQTAADTGRRWVRGLTHCAAVFT